MNISYIVFAGIIVAGISVLPLILKGIHRLFKDYVHYVDKEEEKIQNQKIEETKNDLKETIDNGSLSDLFDAANKLGQNKKKEK